MCMSVVLYLTFVLVVIANVVVSLIVSFGTLYGSLDIARLLVFPQSRREPLCFSEVEDTALQRITANVKDFVDIYKEEPLPIRREAFARESILSGEGIPWQKFRAFRISHDGELGVPCVSGVLCLQGLLVACAGNIPCHPGVWSAVPDGRLVRGPRLNGLWTVGHIGFVAFAAVWSYAERSRCVSSSLDRPTSADTETFRLP